MARERYLLDDSEDTIHQGSIVPKTGKEKRENWWFYHKVHLIVGILATVCVAMIVASFVNRENPDYTISMMTSYTMPSDLLADVEAHLERFADDRNGDGKVIVSIVSYEFPQTQESEYDAGILQASFVKFAADATDGESIIFMYDDASYAYLNNNDMSEFFGPFDGTDNSYYLWSDVPGLRSISIDRYGATEGVSEENVRSVLGKLKVAVRTADGTAFNKEEKMEYHSDCVALMERLMANTPLNIATTE